MNLFQRAILIHKLKKKLKAVEDSASPKNKEWAQGLRARLEASPQNAANILVAEAQRIGENQMRVIEKLEELRNVCSQK